MHHSSSGDLQHRLQTASAVRIGRDAGNDFVIKHPAVSREHARMDWMPSGPEAGAWRITDLGSSAGTTVNITRLSTGQSLTLEPGDIVGIGPLEFIYQLQEISAAKTATMHAPVSKSERIESLAPAALEARYLEVVIQASAAIHAATDERTVAAAAVEAVAVASEFSDIAFVRPADGGGPLEVLAARGKNAHNLRISASVLARARLAPVLVSDATDESDRHGTLTRMRLSRVICAPVAMGDQFYGVLYLGDGGKFAVPLEPVAALVRSIAATAALACANLARMQLNTRLQLQQQSMFAGTMQALIATIDAKDPYTRGHSARVADFAHLLALHAGLSPAEADRARLCGLVHDIGKIGVSETVLRKPSKLTDAEFQEIAAHPVIGHEILRGIEQMEDVLPGVLHHHEKFAGGGYPHGLVGQSIPLMGRIIAIADALDAMTTTRTYRSARPLADALGEIARCAGTHFDPELAAVVQAIERRQLQAIVGLHVFPSVSSIRSAAQAGSAPAVPQTSAPTFGLYRSTGDTRRTA